MALPPQKFREMVFQLLYSDDIGFSEEKDIIEMIMNELKVTKKSALIGQERVIKIRQYLQKLDELIAKIVVSYEFERIQTVERNILRLGAYELLFDDEVPPIVAIAEAVRLAKKFGTPESAGFINAVLDSMYKTSKGENVDEDSILKKADTLKKSEQAATDLQNESAAS